MLRLKHRIEELLEDGNSTAEGTVQWTDAENTVHCPLRVECFWTGTGQCSRQWQRLERDSGFQGLDLGF